MKRITILLVGAACLLSACDDFLTSKDKSQVLENTLFTDREGVEDALYGIYSSLAVEKLYGVDIPLFMDLFAQFYDQFPNNYANDQTQFKYEHERPQLRAIYDRMWKGMYKSISDINNFLANLDTYEGNRLEFENLYRGEALGMRAYLHFDLLRMYAPVKMEERGIPYVTRFGTSVTSFSSVKACYDLIIADLEEAERLLSEDEENLVLPRVRSHKYIMLRNREVHFNLYAAKATLARVYFMRNQPGDLEKAGQYAREIIESEKFPLIAEPKNVPYMVAGVIAETEGIWGLSNTKLYDALYSHYVAERNTSYYYKTTWMHRQLYESADYRGSNGWFAPGMGKSSKLIDPVEYGTSSKAPAGLEGINQIRVAEMYLIAAEACMENDAEKALEYLDALNKARGLTGFSGELTTENLDKEWRKELVHEGQAWFLMKRRHYETVTPAKEGAQNIEMTESMWQMLIPDDEFEFRDESTM